MQQGRYNNYHNTKRQLVGYQPGVAAPAWKANQQVRKASASQVQQGSKILLSKLPTDVSQEEVEALFVKTVGPVKEAFVVYNNQANSKGMAVVSFQRSEDAMVARKKFNGKIIDGRRPIKIEIIKDEDDASKPTPAPAPAGPPSLIDRIGLTLPTSAKPAAVRIAPQTAQPTRKAQPVRVAANKPAMKPRRQKKGPKRLKKVSLSAAELDAQMEEYRAHA